MRLPSSLGLRAALVALTMLLGRAGSFGPGADQARHRDVPFRSSGRSVRDTGAQRGRADGRDAQCGHRARALQGQGLRRQAGRACHHRRGRRSAEAGLRVPQPRVAGRLRRRLHLERRLPGDRPGGRGAEEAHGAVRLRHAAHLRGRQLQVRVPHRSHRHDGQRVDRALSRRAPAQREVDRGPQPELCLGPGLVDRLRGRHEDPAGPASRSRPRRCPS